jgi:hypothetical protein
MVRAAFTACPVVLASWMMRSRTAVPVSSLTRVPNCVGCGGRMQGENPVEYQKDGQLDGACGFGRATLSEHMRRHGCAGSHAAAPTSGAGGSKRERSA